MDLQQVVEQYQQAADEFSRGNPDPVKALFSHRDDVTLANPFGPAVRGWRDVSQALDFASARFRDGQVPGFENVATYAFDLRVTSTFRRQEDGWKLVHRHADPITTFDPRGPLRGS